MMTGIIIKFERFIVLALLMTDDDCFIGFNYRTGDHPG